ncbi:MAG: hypothetical protein QOG60_2630 [Frankiaceae bacterium]|jgi:hypothetical protein|nr:hypothetical protein [Frankiaceae bacterium]
MARRNRTSQPFWRVTPNATSDPGALYRHGVECLNKRDGRGMLASGWALCQVGSLHENQASDFLTDGYRIWRESSGFDRAEAAAFLTDLFDALRSLTPPPAPADIRSASPEQVVPASVYHGTRCWAGNELLEATPDPSVREQYEPQVFAAVTEAPKELVPRRSVDFAVGYAAAHGMDEPWTIVLPEPRDHELVGSAGSSSSSAEATDSSSSSTSSSPAPPRPRPRPTPGVRPTPSPSPSPSPSPADEPDGHPADSATVFTQVLRPGQPQAEAGPPAGAPAPERPRPTPAAPAPQTSQEAEAAQAPQAPQRQTEQQPSQQPEHHAAQQDVPAPLRELRERLVGWLSERYRDVRVEDNGWITVPDIGPSLLQIETSALVGDHLKAEIFAPLVVDVPVTDELLRYVALQGARFHFGAVTLDAEDDVTPGSSDAQGLLQFSHTMLADGTSHEAFLAAVWLIADTVVTQSVGLQRRFGGSLVADLAS